jgi:hypothetical protein
MMKSLSLITLLLSFAAPASAQITGNFIPTEGETINYRYVQRASLDPGGPDQEFYFFEVNDSAVSKFTYTDPASTPFDTAFTIASRNLSIRLGDSYAYYDAGAADGWNIIGYAADNMALEYDQPLTLFPLTMDYSTSAHQIVSDSATSIYYNDGLEVHRRAVITSEVDADGFLSVSLQGYDPFIQGECVRTTTTELYSDSTFVNGIFFRHYETEVVSHYWISVAVPYQVNEEILFIYQTITFKDFSDPSNNTGRTLVRYKS